MSTALTLLCDNSSDNEILIKHAWIIQTAHVTFSTVLHLIS